MAKTPHRNWKREAKIAAYYRSLCADSGDGACVHSLKPAARDTARCSQCQKAPARRVTPKPVSEWNLRPLCKGGGE